MITLLRVALGVMIGGEYALLRIFLVCAWRPQSRRDWPAHICAGTGQPHICAGNGRPTSAPGLAGPHPRRFSDCNWFEPAGENG